MLYAEPIITVIPAVIAAAPALRAAPSAKPDNQHELLQDFEQAAVSQQK